MTTSHSKKGPRTLTRWRLVSVEAEQAKAKWGDLFHDSRSVATLRDPLKCDHERVRYNTGLAGWTCVNCNGRVYDSEERVQHTFVLDQGVSGEGW